MGTARQIVVLLAVTFFAVMCTANEHRLGKHEPHSPRVRRQAANETTSATSSSSTTTQTSTSTTANNATTTTKAANSTTNNSTATTRPASGTSTIKSNSTTTRRPSTAEKEPPVGRRIPCADNNPKTLTTCCQSPIIDYFSDDLKMKCNFNKNNVPLFSVTNEYTLNRMQNRISQIVDYSSTAFVKKFGDEVCLVHCLFRKTDIMNIEGEIDESKLSEYAADNLDETWAQVVKDAVTECAAAVSEVEVEELEVMVKPKVTKLCKLKPSLIMQCIIKQVGLTCPEESFNPSLVCSRTTSQLRYCNPYSAAGIEVGVRKASNKGKPAQRGTTKKPATAKTTTKATTKTSGIVAKTQLKAKKFAPVLRQTYSGAKRTVATNSTRVG